MYLKLVAGAGIEPTYTAYETVEWPLLYPAIEIWCVMTESNRRFNIGNVVSYH